MLETVGDQKERLVVLPTGLALDDLEPTVLLAHELVKHKVPRSKIALALSRVGESEQEIAEARAYTAQAGYMVLAGSIPEKVAFRRASDDGRTLTETRFGSLNGRAAEVGQGIVDHLGKLTKRKAG